MKLGGGLFTLLCGKHLRFPVPISRRMDAWLYRLVRRVLSRRCINDSTPDDVSSVWCLGINGPRWKRRSVSQKKLRACARSLRGPRADTLCHVRPVRAQGQALRLQVQTTHDLPQEASLHDHRRLLLANAGLQFLCRPLQLSHRFPTGLGPALKPANLKLNHA